jgi:undecaprenyl-diphosphatase
MLRNFDRPAAARFAFLMSIPIMLAAGGLETIDMIRTPSLVGLIPVVAVGFVSAAVVGYLSIRWLLAYLMRHSLKSFSIYCLIVGVITLVTAYARG